MQRLLKWLFVLSLVAGALLLMSYTGARVTAGKIVGPHRALSVRTTEFAWKGVERLPGTPPAWVFTYHQSRVPGIAGAEIIVSLTGDVLYVWPADLAELIEQWDLQRLP